MIISPFSFMSLVTFSLYTNSGFVVRQNVLCDKMKGYPDTVGLSHSNNVDLFAMRRFYVTRDGNLMVLKIFAACRH